MDYTRLVTRHQLERLAKAAGHTKPHQLTYADLDRIAERRIAEQKALYRKARELERGAA